MCYSKTCTKGLGFWITLFSSFPFIASSVYQPSLAIFVPGGEADRLSVFLLVVSTRSAALSLSLPAADVVLLKR